MVRGNENIVMPEYYASHDINPSASQHIFLF